MSNKTPLEAGRQEEEYYSGCIYDAQDLWRFRPVKSYLSRVSIADEGVQALKELASRGAVVYAIRQRSKLNSLILTEITARKGLPMPVYSHGVNMSFWQPLSKMMKFLWSSLRRRFRENALTRQAKLDFLAGKVAARESVIIHLGESEFIESRTAEDAIAGLMNLQAGLSFPSILCRCWWRTAGAGRRRTKA